MVTEKLAVVSRPISAVLVLVLAGRLGLKFDQYHCKVKWFTTKMTFSLLEVMQGYKTKNKHIGDCL